MMPSYSPWLGSPVVRAELDSDDPDVIQTGERLTDDDHRLDALRVFREPWPFDWTPPGAKPDEPWDCDVYPSTNGRHAGGERRVREQAPPRTTPRAEGESFYVELHTGYPTPSDPSPGFTWVSSGTTPSFAEWAAAEPHRTLLGLRVEVCDELDCDVALVRPGNQGPQFVRYGDNAWHFPDPTPEIRLSLTFDHPQRDDGEVIPRELYRLRDSVQRRNMPADEFHWEVTPTTWARLAAMSGGPAHWPDPDPSTDVVLRTLRDIQQRHAPYSTGNPLLIVANSYQVATVEATDRGLVPTQWIYVSGTWQVWCRHGGDYVVRTTGVITDAMRDVLECLRRYDFHRIT